MTALAGEADEQPDLSRADPGVPESQVSVLRAPSAAAQAHSAHMDICMIFGKQLDTLPAGGPLPASQESRIDRDLQKLRAAPGYESIVGKISSCREKIKIAAMAFREVEAMRRQHADPEAMKAKLAEARQLHEDAKEAKVAACRPDQVEEFRPLLGDEIVRRAAELGRKIRESMKHGLEPPPCNVFADQAIRAAGGHLPWKTTPRAGNWIPLLRADRHNWQEVHPRNGRFFTADEFEAGDVVIWEGLRRKGSKTFNANHVGIAGGDGAVLYTGSQYGFKAGSMQWWLDQMPGVPNWQFGQPQAVFRPVNEV